MNIFLHHSKMAGYTGYKGYKSCEVLIYQASQDVTGIKNIGLQQVTTGYIYYLYYLCNLCNPCGNKKVTKLNTVQSLDLQGFTKAVTRVTFVTCKKSKSDKNNFSDSVVERLSKLFLRNNRLVFCFRSHIQSVTTFFNFSFPCAPLCPRSLIASKTQRGAAFHGDTHQ
jgi:hypothetical protein